MNSKNPFRTVFLLIFVALQHGYIETKAQIPERFNNIVYASPFTTFYGGRGFGLAYEHYLNRSKRFSVFVPVSFGFRDYFVTHSNSTRQLQQTISKPPEAKNYSFMLHPGIKFYAGKNTSFLSYVIGTSTFLSYGTEDGFKLDLNNSTQNAIYRYSAGNEIRWGGKFDQFLNFRISERILMEIQGSFGFVHYTRFLQNGKSTQPSSYASEVMGLIGISFGCRL